MTWSPSYPDRQVGKTLKSLRMSRSIFAEIKRVEAPRRRSPHSMGGLGLSFSRSPKSLRCSPGGLAPRAPAEAHGAFHPRLRASSCRFAAPEQRPPRSPCGVSSDARVAPRRLRTGSRRPEEGLSRLSPGCVMPAVGWPDCLPPRSLPLAPPCRSRLLAPTWQSAAANARLCRMDTVNLAPGDSAYPPCPETDAEKQRRLAWEAEGLVRARFDRRRLLRDVGRGECLDRQPWRRQPFAGARSAPSAATLIRPGALPGAP